MSPCPRIRTSPSSAAWPTTARISRGATVAVALLWGLGLGCGHTTSSSGGSSSSTGGSANGSTTSTNGSTTSTNGSTTSTNGSTTSTNGSTTSTNGTTTSTNGSTTSTNGSTTSGSTGATTGGSGLTITRFDLDKLQVVAGDTITGTLVLTNVGSTPVTIRSAVVAGRPPGGTHAGGPYDDFAPTATGSTIAAGASLTLTAQRTVSASDPLGSWESYGTWQDSGGVWHDGSSLFFTVGAASTAGTTGGTTTTGSTGGSTGGTTGGNTHPMAPNGYYVVGNTIYDAAGNPHLFHGVDRPTLESDAAGYMLSASDYQLMAGWKAHIVRIALNQDFWLSGAALYSPSFAATVDQQVQWAHAAGLDVILDLHCSDKGDLSATAPSQQLMADQNSIRFWREVATKYKDDGRVLFELYNEPHDISWDIWQSGGVTTEGWTAVGMQQLYDTVRATGAENVVLIGGNSWSSDLSGVPTHRIVGHNIVYAAHPYDWPNDRTTADWTQLWGNLSATDPVILTEFGDSPQTVPACSSSYYSSVIAFADAHNVSWTSWAWMVWSDPCNYPTILSDWSGTPNAMGTVVKQALQSYP